MNRLLAKTLDKSKSVLIKNDFNKFYYILKNNNSTTPTRTTTTNNNNILFNNSYSTATTTTTTNNNNILFKNSHSTTTKTIHNNILFNNIHSTSTINNNNINTNNILFKKFSTSSKSSPSLSSQSSPSPSSSSPKSSSTSTSSTSSAPKALSTSSTSTSSTSTSSTSSAPKASSTSSSSPKSSSSPSSPTSSPSSPSSPSSSSSPSSPSSPPSSPSSSSSPSSPSSPSSSSSTSSSSSSPLSTSSASSPKTSPSSSSPSSSSSSSPKISSSPTSSSPKISSSPSSSASSPTSSSPSTSASASSPSSPTSASASSASTSSPASSLLSSSKPSLSALSLSSASQIKSLLNSENMNDIFSKKLFSHFNKRDLNSKYYDFKFEIADKTTNRNKILELIKNEPNNNLHYQKLSAHIGVNGKTKLNGKLVDQLDLHLIQIKNNPKDKFIFFNLFAYMKEIANLEQVTLLNGEVITLRECLIREITNNPSYAQSYLALFPLMDHLINDTFEVDWYKINENGELFKDIEPNIIKVNKIKLITMAFFVDGKNRHALNLMSFFAMESNGHFLRGIRIIPFFINWNNLVENRDFHPQSIFYFSKYLNPWWRYYMSYEEFTTTLSLLNGIEGSKISLLIEGITKFPDYPKFYYTLASILTNNNQFVKIKKQPSSSSSSLSVPSISPSSGSEQFIEMNRIDLLMEGVNVMRRNPSYNTIDLCEFYCEFAHYLESNETVKFVDYDGLEKELNKKELLIKAIEVSEDYIVDKPINQLLVLMSPDETVMINGEPHSRIDVSNIKDRIGNSYELLSKIYDRENNIEQYNKYNQLFIEYKDIAKQHYIKEIENDHEEKCSTFYYLELSKIMQDNEKVIINGESFGKFDLLNLNFETIGNDPEGETCQIAKNLQYFKSELSLKRLYISELDIRYETMHFSTETMFDYINQTLDLHYEYEEEKRLNRVFCLNTILSMDPLCSLAYLKLGIEMYNSSTDVFNRCEEEIPFYLDKPLRFIYCKGEIKFTRKQLFLKFLELSKTDFTLNENDILLGWYHLAAEMDSNEIQFGKTKKQILLSIIEKDETFSRAYIELSTILSMEKIIELMVRAINVESDVNIKSNHYYKLSQYLKDNNEYVKLDDGSIMNKQQLLVESIELTPSSKKHSLAYYSLANLLTNSTDTIELLGKDYTQSKLFELALENKDALSLNQIFEIKFIKFLIKEE
ncbi:hypothetical protein ACTFIW_000377 [Dictyostelium discoideum]